MSHADQIRFFDLAVATFPEHFAGRVLDIGALDINGGPHERMQPREYIGVDLAAGPNVTLIGRGEDVELPSGSFDVTMSSECFEHNPAWMATLHNMIRMTRPSGLVVFTCATRGRPEHGTSRSDAGFGAPLAVAAGQEHYANVTPREVRTVIADGRIARSFTVVNDRMFDLYFAGLREPATASDLARLAELEASVKATFVDRRSFPSTRAFAAARARRYVATVVGDPALEVVRRRRLARQHARTTGPSRRSGG